MLFLLHALLPMQDDSALIKSASMLRSGDGVAETNIALNLRALVVAPSCFLDASGLAERPARKRPHGA